MFAGEAFEWTAPAVLASGAAALVATAGLVTVVKSEAWAERNSAYFAAFAAGILLTTALFLIPEGLEATPYAPYFVLLGYFLLYFINLMVAGGEGKFVAALIPFVAVGFHSYLDGFEYGILFGHDEFVGYMASVGLIAHEFAEGVLLYILLRRAGLLRPFAVFMAFIGAALTTPAGALSAQLLLPSIEADLMGILLSVAAGALLYVGATHLTDHMKEGQKQSTLIAYMVGLTVAIGFSAAHMHSHDHHAIPTGHIEAGTR